MEHKIGLPDTDLSVSLIGLGTSNIGLNMEEKEADRLLDGYLELGGNLIDTAHVYSNWVLGERARIRACDRRLDWTQCAQWEKGADSFDDKRGTPGDFKGRSGVGQGASYPWGNGK